MQASWQVGSKLNPQDVHSNQKGPCIIQRHRGGEKWDIPCIRQEQTGRTDLPTGITWETTDLHAMLGASRARGGALVVAKAAFTVSRSARKLNGQTLAHELGSILLYY